MLFECYFDSAHSGIHFGGGHPAWYRPADLRGSTVAGGRHVEALHLLTVFFDCEAACLGPCLHEPWLRAAGIPVRSTAGDVATFYRELFANSKVTMPRRLLVVGDGGKPQGIDLTPYAFPEVVEKRALAVADGDDVDVVGLAPGARLEGLWLSAERVEVWAKRGCETFIGGGEARRSSVASQTAWFAERWSNWSGGYLLGDPELVGRWTPTAVRNRWLPLYGMPQADVIDLMAQSIARFPLLFGRQHHDSDFVKLSQLGVSFQVIDPGGPPFPVIREAWPLPGLVRQHGTMVRNGPGPNDREDAEPSDSQLRRWASEGRVLVTLLFWSGMVRELQSLYPLADVLSITGLRSGIVLTTESYAYMAGTPLEMLSVPADAGGLYPRVEPLITDTGCGVILAGEAPPHRFADALLTSMAGLRAELGDGAVLPRGWWAHMDAPLVEGAPPRVTFHADNPRLRIRFQARERQLAEPGDTRDVTRPQVARQALRDLVRESPLGHYLSPRRPYEGFRPGSPSRAVLEAVRAAGFEYAITKSGYGPVPRVVSGVDDLAVYNQTAGRWDGWSPFHTVNTLADLRQAERRLLRRRQAGWLVGALDTCLWAFTGPVWKRGCELYDVCRWVEQGGSTGTLVNVGPGTVARYARILAETGAAEPILPG